MCPDLEKGHVKGPKPVERIYVTRVLRTSDGIEHLIDESETIYPLEVTPEEHEPEVVEDEEKDRRGVVIRRVVRRPVMVTTKRTVIRKLEILPDGEEKEIEKSVEESPRTEEEPEKTRRVVRRVVKEPTGEERVTEEPEYVSPLEISTTEESEPELEEKIVRGKVIRTVRRRSVITSQRRIVRRVVERKDGKPEDVPIEDTVEEPVEPTKFTLVRRTVIRRDGTKETVEEPQYEMPVEAEPVVEEEKNRLGVVVRRVVRRPVPVVTRRRVYRKVILAPDGIEKKVEERVEEPQHPKLVEPTEDYIAAPMVVDEQESVPDMFGDEPDVATETVLKRQVHRRAVPYEKPKDESPTQHKPEEAAILQDSQVIRKRITVRKRIIRKIIVLPDGTRKDTEKEVPVEDEPVKHIEIIRREVHREYIPDLVKVHQKRPRPVERVYITKVVRKADGIEHLVNESEIMYPLEVTPEEQEPEIIENEEKDHRGVVIRRVVRRPVMVTTKRSVIRRVEVLPDGQEKEIESSVEESSTTEEPHETQRVVGMLLKELKGAEKS